MEQKTIFWFRRDLRLTDNHGLFKALSENENILPIFIFDTNILKNLPKDDARVTFLHSEISDIKNKLNELGSDLHVFYGEPEKIWEEIVSKQSISNVYTNHDYEPYGIERDAQIEEFLRKKNIPFHTFKDIVIFEKKEVTKADGNPYTVFTPYSRKWKEQFTQAEIEPWKSEKHFENLFQTEPTALISLKDMGFTESTIKIPEKIIRKTTIKTYDQTRDIPSLDKGTSHLGLHLRFGTLSIRHLLRESKDLNEIFVNELIWRDFYMQILWNFPHVVNGAFRPKYDHIQWENNPENFKKWCEGKTGYPLIDAGMRELNTTGYMHNRVRMVVASFLCKHLLIDWRWGEKYFAEKLLDFELASNNGGWQWSAGTGCDASPYFRVFNPTSQQKKFDPKFEYIKKWIPEYGTEQYPAPIIEHSFARNRAIERYQQAVK